MAPYFWALGPIYLVHSRPFFFFFLTLSSFVRSHVFENGHRELCQGTKLFNIQQVQPCLVWNLDSTVFIPCYTHVLYIIYWGYLVFLLVICQCACVSLSNSEYPCFLFVVLVLVPPFIFPPLDSFLTSSYLHGCSLDSDDQCAWYSLHILNRYLCHEWIFLSKFQYLMISRDLDFKVPWISLSC